jgi:serine/threonine protein kinase
MPVAVKKLFNQEHAEQSMREFRAEVSILSRLRHPSIVLWLGACTTAGAYTRPLLSST